MGTSERKKALEEKYILDFERSFKVRGRRSLSDHARPTARAVTARAKGILREPRSRRRFAEVARRAQRCSLKY